MLIDAFVFGLAALVLYGLVAARRPRLRCRDAVEGAGLKLEPDMYCEDAFGILRALDAFALPVTVGKHFLGFFSLTDVFKSAGRDSAALYIGSIMTPVSECGYLRANSSLEHARRELLRSPYPMLPVLDGDAALLGFVTKESLARSRGTATSKASTRVARRSARWTHFHRLLRLPPPGSGTPNAR